MIVYFDSSALVKRYVRERESDQVKKLFEASDIQAITSLITRAEVLAALAKARRTKRLAESDALNARRCFEQEWEAEDIAKIEITDNIVKYATELAWRHDLKGYDSVHLASALFLKAVRKGLNNPSSDLIKNCGKRQNPNI